MYQQKEYDGKQERKRDRMRGITKLIVICVLIISLVGIVCAIGNARQDITAIPTSECPLDQESNQTQAYLLCVNTGELFKLDPFSGEEAIPGETCGYFKLRTGSDRTGAATVQMLKDPDNHLTLISVNSNDVSVYLDEMGEVLCEECIHELMDSIGKRALGGFVFFDGTNHCFYPVREGTVMLAGGSAAITLEEERYDMIWSAD